MKFKVTYEYRGKVTVDMDAKNLREAEVKAASLEDVEEADSLIAGYLGVWDVTVKPAKD